MGFVCGGIQKRRMAVRVTGQETPEFTETTLKQKNEKKNINFN